LDPEHHFLPSDGLNNVIQSSSIQGSGEVLQWAGNQEWGGGALIVVQEILQQMRRKNPKSGFSVLKKIRGINVDTPVPLIVLYPGKVVKLFLGL
jgi:hypothetical protein